VFHIDRGSALCHCLSRDEDWRHPDGSADDNVSDACNSGLVRARDNSKTDLRVDRIKCGGRLRAVGLAVAVIFQSVFRFTDRGRSVAHDDHAYLRLGSSR